MILENLAIIVAISENGAIGRNNQLLWHIPEDLKYFKEKTTGHPVIMGKNTWLSLPKRPLPNRINIVISKNLKINEECIIFNNIQQCIEFIKQQKQECFVIGGESIYKQFIDYTKWLYITWVHSTCNDADAFFPIEKLAYYKLIEKKDTYSIKSDLDLSFTVYQRK